MTLSRRSLLAGSAAALSAATLAGPQIAASEEQATVAPVLPGKTKNTKFAVNCEMWWGKLPLLDRLRQTAELGFPAVEFWPYQGKDIDAIKKLKDELKIAIAQFSAWGF